ncbi:hypothetical protein McanCB56680_002096 [Microsporum canis]
MAFLYPLEQSHKQQKTDDDYFDLQTTASAEWTKDQPTHSSFQAALKRRYQTLASDPSGSCSPKALREIKRLSRRGGPDLSDLRGIPLYQPMDTNLGCRKRRANSPPPGESSYKRTTTVTAAYNRNFEQKLVDRDIYLDGYDHSDGQPPATPNNMDEIMQRLAQPRRSLSPTNFPESKFREFKQKDARASKERPVTTYIVPTIDGDVGNTQCVGGGYLFGNLAPLTDSTLAIAKPGHFFGSLPKYLEPEIRDELSEYIIPSTQANLPMLPNFFLEAKGPDTSLAVAIR